MPTNLEKVIGDAARTPEIPDYVDVESVVAYEVVKWMKEQYANSNGDFDFVMWLAKQQAENDDE